MSKQPNEPKPSIRLVGNSETLGARFQPPLAESELFDAILLNCPVKAIDRNDEDGSIAGITYKHIIYGVKGPNIKPEFATSYATVAEKLGRVLSGRGSADQAPAVLTAASPN